MNQAINSTSSSPSTPVTTRLASVDAYRGLVMFLMMAEVLHIHAVSRALPDSRFWSFLANQQSHVEWIGCVLHDMIQPSFSFLVGIALPFSIANRIAKGQAFTGLTIHAFWRAFLLILMGIFLRSYGASQTNFTFEDTLTQIGLGYGFLFMLGFCSTRTHWISLGAILFGYWLAFALYPLPAANFDLSSVGVPKDWPNWLTGFAAHWNKNTNFAWAFDTWFMNLFPREHPFQYNGGGYSTLSFIPTLGTMILGLIAGTVLRNNKAPWEKVRWFGIAGISFLAAGSLIGWLGICPVVKRIWTPSWVLFSGGWCFLFTGAFYAVVDIWQKKTWAFPLIVIGMNSIAAYFIAHLCPDFIGSNLRTNFGNGIFMLLGKPYEPFLDGAAILFVLWLMLFWMYKRKLFLKV